MNEISDPSENYYVSLPVTPDQFSDFIRDVLSTKKSMQYRFRGNIQLDEELIRHLLSAIDERLAQNPHKKVQESYTVSFSNGESFVESTLDEVLASSSIEPVATTAFQAKISVLVKFPSEVSLHKQEISIVFSKNSSHARDWQKIGNADFIRHRFYGSDAYIEVQYSNRTWSEDVINISKKVINSSPYDLTSGFDNRLSQWISKKSGEIALAISAISVFSFVFFTNRIFYSKSFSRYLEIKEGEDGDFLKIIYGIMIEQDSMIQAGKALTFLLCFFLAALVPALLFTSIFKITEDGLVFSIYRKDKELLAKNIKRQKYNKLAALFSFFIAIISSMVASFLYGYMSP